MKYHGNVVEFLRTKKLAVLSTVSADGAPQSATVFFHLSDLETESRFHLYFLTRRHTRKFSNLLASKMPKVSMVIGTELEPFSVQFEGVAEFIESAADVEGLAEFNEKLLSDSKLALLYMGTTNANDPFPKIEGTDFAVFRVNPTWVRFMHPDESGKKMEYTQILP